MKPLSIDEIKLTNFKNYREQNFRLGNRINLVYGLNGTGKTNLLDSIYYLSVGKSFFTAFDQKVVAYGEDFFRIEGNLTKGDSKHEIVIKVKPGESKTVILDGLPRNRVSDHLGFIPVVISAPKDIELVSGTGQSRRRYVDHLLCQIIPDYLKSLVTYNHLLAMRNAALKADFKDLRRMIMTYDEQISPHAHFIFEKRKWLQEEISPLLQANYKLLSDDRENVSISYESKLNGMMFEFLADMNWESDRNLQRTNAGIHKDDFALSIKNMPAKDYASQGQIKSIIFALHLSKYKILASHSGYKPLLIFDDIFDKLDEHRLARLMEILVEPEFGQVYLSDTNRKRVGNFVTDSQLTEIETIH